MLSRKNHKMIDGKLLQTDKKYSHLKLKQKEKIAEWMYLETKAYYEKNYTFPGDKQIGDVISKVYDRITDANIWIPYGEVVKHYKKKRADINKRVILQMLSSVKFTKRRDLRLKTPCSVAYIIGINRVRIM